jgi:hypothetical protein
MNQNIRAIFLLILIVSMIPIACNGGEMEHKAVKFSNLSEVPDSTWEKLANKKTYFGHQSVGYNILSGIEIILKNTPQIKLKIKETYNPDEFEKGTISHSPIGNNTDPASKLTMFNSIAKSGGAEKADIMLMKFCYIDFNKNTDVKGLFEKYRTTLEKLKAKYPGTYFIHLTVPLTTIQSGPKAWVKRIIGRPISGIVENSKRHEFNEMIRTTYSKKEPVFDIAAIESTYPDGRRATFEMEGKTYYHLVPNYTNDGGHLNENGRKIVAEKLLLTIVETL